MSEPVEALNLMVNPKPTGTRGWARFGNVEVSMTANPEMLYCRNISGGGGRGIDYALPELPPGDYVYGFWMHSTTYTQDEVIALIKNGATSYCSTIRFNETPGEHAYTGEFTITQTGVNWLFTPPQAVNGALSVNRLLLVTREDWVIMRENNVSWFDGDSIVRGGGFPSSRLYPHVDYCHALVVVA